jgi:hypothetical protein
VRVRFSYTFTDDDGQQQLAVYNADMVCAPRIGDTVNFRDRQVDVADVVWNLDPSIAADVVITLS